MVKGIIFDMDGTLTRPNMDFGALMADIGSELDEPVLEYMEMVDEEERVRVMGILERFEARASSTAELNDGARELLDFVVSKGKKTALLTRNSRHSVNTILSRLKLDFDCIVSRDDARPKPSPEPVFLIGRRLGIDPGELLLVGDYKFDVICGKAAGARTALLCNHQGYDMGVDPDYELTSLTDLIPILNGEW